MPLTLDTLRPLILQAPDQLPTALGMARPGGLRVAALRPPTCILGGHPDRCPGVPAGVRDRMADTHRLMVGRPEATVAELRLTPDSTPVTLDTPGTRATPVMPVMPVTPDTLAPSEIRPVLTRRPVMVACTTKKLKKSLLRTDFFFLSVFPL